MPTPKIYLDAHGGDHAPQSIIDGALLAQKSIQSEIILVGNQEEIAPLLKTKSATFQIAHAPEVIEMSDSPGKAVRKKPKSSIMECCRLTSLDRSHSACLSAGNSGAMMAAALLILRRLPGASRPAIAVLYPTIKSDDLLILDMGANVDVKAENLVQFAQMGDLYMKLVLNRPHPRIAILSNGEEKSKGTETTRFAYQTLENMKELNFKGYAEGRDIFSGELDVVVTDGFTGNIVLKATEGLAKAIISALKEEAQTSFSAKLGFFIASSPLKLLKKKTDYRERGAAPLLGVDGMCFISHGSSDAYAISNALKSIDQAITNHFYDSLSGKLNLATDENF